MTTETQTIQYIPLTKLCASPRNVRRTNRKEDIDALAASIASQGLLQNLCVVAAAEGKFEVDAGGRRLLALKRLARTGVIARDAPIACHVVEASGGREVSLTENIHRVAMDAMDEVEAYAVLVTEGMHADDVARRFGVTRRHVDQRLALAGLSPKIKAAWKRRDVTLDVARAFCLVQDHGQQEAVYRSLGKPITHAGSVRARLMDGRVHASDRLALFVGLEAYEAAGGKLARDLFDAEAAYIENPALLARLAEDKLEGNRAAFIAEGWGWVELHLGEGRASGVSGTRLYPEWRDPTADEQAELDRLTAELDKLDADLDETATDDDARWSQRDDLEAAYESLRQTARCWSTEAKQLAGVVLSIAHDGTVAATEGAVRLEDEKRVSAYLKAKRAGDTQRADDAGAAERPPVHVSALPKAVNRELTEVRTRVIRQTLSEDCDVALALCVASLAHRCLRHAELPGVAISGRLQPADDLPRLADARNCLQHALPDKAVDLLDWALDLSRERLLSVLAVLVASTVDVANEDTTPADLATKDVADRLSQRLDIDMRAYWTPGIDFWVRLPKAGLLAALADAPGLMNENARSREEALNLC